jgi:carbohydrate-selective porin OprB
MSNPTGHKETPVAVVPGADQPSITSIIPVLGDFKKGFLDRGINFQLSYIQDTFGNPFGGVKQGAIYGSVLYMAIDADLAKIAGLPGATFRVNAYQIQGRSLSTYNPPGIGELATDTMNRRFGPHDQRVAKE